MPDRCARRRTHRAEDLGSRSLFVVSGVGRDRLRIEGGRCVGVRPVSRRWLRRKSAFQPSDTIDRSDRSLWPLPRRARGFRAGRVHLSGVRNPERRAGRRRSGPIRHGRGRLGSHTSRRGSGTRDATPARTCPVGRLGFVRFVPLPVRDRDRRKGYVPELRRRRGPPGRRAVRVVVAAGTQMPSSR